MAILDGIGDKVKGKLRKTRGGFKQNSPDLGDKISGTIDKVSGGIQDAVGDAKLRSRRRNDDF
jgi:uncharacterized protein YjbJ (UPF0337 family)